MSDDNIVRFPGETTKDIPIKDVLEGVDRPLEKVLVIGWEETGALWISSSFSDVGQMNLLLDVVKRAILDAAIHKEYHDG